jgi:hypothetical protein
LLVTWLISKIWPPQEPGHRDVRDRQLPAASPAQLKVCGT